MVILALGIEKIQPINGTVRENISLPAVCARPRKADRKTEI
jgi:hypothetical protein